MKHIVCISGTNRPNNFTSLALGVVTSELKKLEVEVVVYDAREMSLNFPGFPETEDANRLQQSIEGAAGVVLASPEYHGSFSAMTKLIIENLGFPSVLSGKPISLLGVAAGRIGAIKSLEQLKGVCSHVGAIVVPGSVSIAGVQNIFDDQGRCVDEGSESALKGLAGGLHSFVKSHVCPVYILEEMTRNDGEPWSTNV